MVHRLPPAARVLWRIAPPVIRGYARRRWDLRVEHEAPFPAPPYVVAANHPSGLDPALVGAVHGRPVVFLALDELYDKHPLLRVALTGFGAIPIPRGRVPLAALRTALDALASGYTVGVFPEGRRSPVWGAAPVKPGAAWLAARSGRPLVPIAVHGTAAAVTMDNRFGHGPVGVTVGAPLHAAGPGRPAVADLHERWRAWMEDRLR